MDTRSPYNADIRNHFGLPKPRQRSRIWDLAVYFDPVEGLLTNRMLPCAPAVSGSLQSGLAQR